MNFRRQPFQFSTIDPVKRQAELQKRFGLPTTNSDMFVDFLNPGVMGSGIKGPSLGGSPRLQHRVPIFTEKLAKGNFEQNNVDGNHKPKVRIVPIQVEGVDGGKRHRTYSGPAGISDGNCDISKEKLQEAFPNLHSTNTDEKMKGPSQPRVCNIPIEIEPREKPSVEPREEKPSVDLSPPTPEPLKKLKPESNGCAASSEKKEEPDKTVPLKQIDAVLNKLKLYTDEVEKFSGTSKDKQYRYLDEMLTRCMLDLDNVDTMGLNEIRKTRKEAVKQVQHYVDLLDTKVNEKMDSNSSVNLVADSKDEQMACDIPIESINLAISGVNCGESSDLNNQCAPNDIEMVADDLIEVSSDTKDLNESSDHNNQCVSNDVEMVEENNGSDSVPEMTNEELVGIDGKESKDSVSCNTSGSGLENLKIKSKIVIEELEDTPENEFNVSTSVNDVSCVVSDSLELDVKDTIVEESDSEIVIEEVEDLDEKDIEYSKNICDKPVDCPENLSEQIKNDTCKVNFSSTVPVVQKAEMDSKKL